MELRKSSGLLACTCLLALALLSGCGGSSTTTTIPANTTIFDSHSVIFKNNTVMTIGYNGFGQLGIGNLVDQPSATPVVPNLAAMDGASAGGDHTLAFSSSIPNTVFAWGSNYHGQIGGAVTTVGSGAFSSTPLAVTLPGAVGSGKVTDAAAGAFHSLAVMDNVVYSWGYNGFGQLGDRLAADGTVLNTLADNTLPAKVTFLGAVLTNAAKVAAGGAHSLVLRGDGTVLAWGDNSSGQLGINPASPNSLTKSSPQQVQVKDALGALTPLAHVLKIAAGGSNSYAIVDDGTGTGKGTVWAWGFNGMGQTGQTPTLLVDGSVVQVKNADGSALIATDIAAGLDHVLALRPDGTVVAWGFGEFGQLGNNASPNSSVPVVVLKDGTAAGGPLSGVTRIAAFGNSSLALVGSNPGVWFGWGDNGFGQLGNPVSNTSLSKLFVPTTVKGF